MIKFPLVSLRKRPGYQFAATWIGYGKRHRHDCQYVDGKTAYGCVQHRVSAHLIFINSPNHLKKYLIIILQKLAYFMHFLEADPIFMTIHSP